MTRRNLIIGAVATLLLGLIVTAFLLTFHRVEREIDLPPPPSTVTAGLSRARTNDVVSP